MGNISGNPAPFTQPTRIHSDDSGVTTTFSFEGTDIDTINGLAIGFPFPYDITQSFGKARIEKQYPYDFINGNPQTDFLGLWEFFANTVEKDLTTVNLPNGSIGPISPADAWLIRTALNLSAQGLILGQGWFQNPVGSDGNALTQQVVTGGIPPVETQNVPPAANPTGCWTIFVMNLKEVKSAIVFAPQLRFTKTVTAEYAIPASLLNAGKIISTDSLPTLEQIPSGLLFSLPDDQDNNPPTQYILTPGDLVYGWFKLYPNVRQIARLKWTIVQEWQYGLWFTGTYGELL